MRMKIFILIMITILLSILFTEAIFIVGYSAEEECLKSRIWCYECESQYDRRCADPFNITVEPINLPDLKACEGCCVKIVMNRDTPFESVRRTCTSSILINLFMVDHVCMEESDGHGHMCFCESDACNKANNQYFHHHISYILPIIIMILRVMMNLNI